MAVPFKHSKSESAVTKQTPPASPASPLISRSKVTSVKPLFNENDLKTIQLKTPVGQTALLSLDQRLAERSRPGSTLPSEDQPDLVRPSALRKADGSVNKPGWLQGADGSNAITISGKKSETLPVRRPSKRGPNIETKQASIFSAPIKRMSPSFNNMVAAARESHGDGEGLSEEKAAELVMRDRNSIIFVDPEFLLRSSTEEVVESSESTESILPSDSSILPSDSSSTSLLAATTIETAGIAIPPAAAAAASLSPLSARRASIGTKRSLLSSDSMTKSSDDIKRETSIENNFVSPLHAATTDDIGVRRRSLVLPRTSNDVSNKTTSDSPILTKEDLELHIAVIAEKARELSKLCQVRTKQDAMPFRNNMIVFQFKELVTLVLDLMGKLNAQVDVSEVYEAAIDLSTAEKWVVAGLDELRRSGSKPAFADKLKKQLITLLAATKKAASDYMIALARAPKPLFVEVPGFRLELGRLQPVNMKSIKYRMSYSFSASASVLREVDGEPTPVSYADATLEHVDDNATFYRNFFYQQDHRNYLGIDDKMGPVAVSIKKELLPNSQDEYQYRSIFRTKEGDLRSVFAEASVYIPSRMRNKPAWKDVIHTINPSLNPAKLEKCKNPKLQDELLRFDEYRYIVKYKFGILYCKGGQTSEDQIFGNEHGSEAFESFITFLGQKIKLTEHTKYAGGLATNETTGTHSIYAEWRKNEVMFHVSTLLPYSHSADDKQQIQRKRHIGNDIVTIVFMDGQGQYDPRTVKSQFLHIFIIVQRIKSTTPGVSRYRIAVSSNEDVPEFGPVVPKPAEFDQNDEFRHFLFAKMINGENAAYKAPKFREPHERAREGLVTHLVESMLKDHKIDIPTTKLGANLKSGQNVKLETEHTPTASKRDNKEDLLDQAEKSPRVDNTTKRRSLVGVFDKTPSGDSDDESKVLAVPQLPAVDEAQKTMLKEVTMKGGQLKSTGKMEHLVKSSDEA